MQHVDLSKILPIEAPTWASSGHLQTILGSLWRFKTITRPSENRLVQLPDGDQLLTKVFRQEHDAVVVLFHGLTGSSDSSYMQRLGSELLRQGYSVVLVNHRNCGDGFGLARQLYHSGRGDDIAAVVADVRGQFPGKKLVTFGVSLSANAILFLLSQLPHLSQPDFAIVVNPPIDLSRTSRLIQTGMVNKIYEKKFVVLISRLVNELQRHGLVEPHYKLHSRMRLGEIDEVYTGPKGGFGNAQGYYDQCSTYRHLTHIKTPTVMLMAEDDPFISSQDFIKVEKSPFVQLHLVRTGGHVGYIHKRHTPLGSYRWMDYAVSEYIKQFVSIKP